MYKEAVYIYVQDFLVLVLVPTPASSSDDIDGCPVAYSLLVYHSKHICLDNEYPRVHVVHTHTHNDIMHDHVIFMFRCSQSFYH